MNNKTKHRGIRSNVELHENIGLGSIRLPIQGLDEKFDCPFHLNNDCDILLYNGEIYNYKELDSNAKSDIELFNDPTGIDPTKFDGDFAYVIYNKNNCKLEIVTDRYGKKQLYYKIRDGYISGISSEIKALVDEDDELDKYYLSTVARFGYVFNNDSTFVKSIKRFYPGKRYIINDSGIIEKIYDIEWNSDNLIPKNVDKNDLKSLIELSIKRRLTSDIPIALVYSGGIDSSIVLYHLKQLNQKLKVFTVKNSNDYEFAKKYADELGIELNYINLSDDYENAHFSNESAVDLGSVLPKYSLFKNIKEYKFNVCLGGTGCDEIAGGYKRMFEYDSQQNDIFNELIYYHLPRVEKLSMANTVEYRTPYTADYLVDFFLKLSYNDRINKQFLRNTYKNLIPDYIVNRKKEPLKTDSIREDKIKERMKLIEYFKKELFNKYKK